MHLTGLSLKENRVKWMDKCQGRDGNMFDGVNWV